MHAPDVMDTLLPREDLSGVLYYEVLGTFPEKADEIFRTVRERIEGWRAVERPGGPRVGLSPHTPHTVSHRLMRLLCDYAAGEGCPSRFTWPSMPPSTTCTRAAAAPSGTTGWRPSTPTPSRRSSVGHPRRA